MIIKTVCKKRSGLRAKKTKEIYKARIKKLCDLANRCKLEKWAKKLLNTRAARMRAMKIRRLERIKTNGGSHTEKEWGCLKDIHYGKCVFCGSTEKIQKDHIIPICLGGRDSIDNIQPLCWKCNFKKGKRVITKDQTPLMINHIGYAK